MPRYAFLWPCLASLLLTGCLETEYPNPLESEMDCGETLKHYSRLHDEMAQRVEWTADTTKLSGYMKKRAPLVEDYQLALDDCAASGEVDADAVTEMNRNITMFLSVGQVDLDDPSTYEESEEETSDAEG